MKKYMKYLIAIAISYFSFINVVSAASAKLNLCQEEEVLTTFKFIGYGLYVLKVVIPILLLIFGMIDMSKAVVASDSDAIKKSTGSLVQRTIASVVIFLVPTLVDAAFTLVDNIDNAKSDFEPCEKCLFNPESC